ncbi:unnamed protein product [Amoebophrya sp. A120]|nr:unnamed protein product [Amoebophrya sp. A120]|eukprot:GSA120T00001424001.1
MLCGLLGTLPHWLVHGGSLFLAAFLPLDSFSLVPNDPLSADHVADADWQSSMWFRLFLLCIIDALGMNRLWGERVHRRCLHHVEKNVLNPSRQPFLRKLRQFQPVQKYLAALQKLDLSYGDRAAGGGNRWSIISRLSVAQYSPRATIYYDAMNVETKELVDAIGAEVAHELENHIGEKIFLSPKTSSFRACILRYEGEASEFPWHYDTEHPSCYRALFLFHKEGNISPLQYYDSNQELQTYHQEVSDGWIFKGTSTLHRVPRNDDPSSKRYMLGFQFAPEPSLIDSHISICSTLRQATPAKILWEFAPCFFICWFAVLFGHTSSLKQSFQRVFLFYLSDEQKTSSLSRGLQDEQAWWTASRTVLFYTSVMVTVCSMFLPSVLAQYISVRPDEYETGSTTTAGSTCPSSDDETEVEQDLMLLSSREINAVANDKTSTRNSNKVGKQEIVVNRTVSNVGETSASNLLIPGASASARSLMPERTLESELQHQQELRCRANTNNRSSSTPAGTTTTRYGPTLLQDFGSPGSTKCSTFDSSATCSTTARSRSSSSKSCRKQGPPPVAPTARTTTTTTTATSTTTIKSSSSCSGQQPQPSSQNQQLSATKTTTASGLFWSFLAATTGVPEKRYCGDHRPFIGTGMNKSVGTLARMYLGCVLSAVDLQTGFYFMAYLLDEEMEMRLQVGLPTRCIPRK